MLRVLFFTAAQIAVASGRSKRRVLELLATVPADGVALVRGKPAAAWSTGSLPAALCEEIAESARKRGFRNAEHLLSDPPAAWQPKIDGDEVTLAEISEDCITSARRLQRALLPSLTRASSEAYSSADKLEARGLVDYRAEFKNTVSARYWRALLERVLLRDSGAQDFSRLELFLPDRLKRRVEREEGSSPIRHLEHLRKALDMVRLPAAPTREEREFIWDSAFLEMQWLAEEGDRRQAKRTVFAALSATCVTLAKSREALERTFSLKLAKWIEGGCKPSALRDNRPERSGNFRAGELAKEDREILLARIVERGGRLAQAWRDTREAGELSPNTEQRFLANPASKSHVPRSVRDALRYDVALLDDLHHGPRQARLRGPYIPRDYSDISPGDWHQADDCTLPIYFAEETAEGICAMRGQFLPMLDVKTGFIFGFALHSDRNYTAADIRALIVRVHDEYGLPRQGFYFEGGLWKRSRLLKGRAADEITLDDTELGLREYVRFMHAKLPRAKVIEGILGILQNQMEPLPGYVGRNEVTEKFERIQKQLLQARTGKIPYADFLLPKETWVQKLEEICQRYNNEPQGDGYKVYHLVKLTNVDLTTAAR